MDEVEHAHESVASGAQSLARTPRWTSLQSHCARDRPRMRDSHAARYGTACHGSTWSGCLRWATVRMS